MMFFDKIRLLWPGYEICSCGICTSITKICCLHALRSNLWL